jgi:hypothetical protein
MFAVVMSKRYPASTAIPKFSKLNPRGGKWQEAGEDCIMRSFINCMPHQTLLG